MMITVDEKLEVLHAINPGDNCLIEALFDRVQSRIRWATVFDILADLIRDNYISIYRDENGLHIKRPFENAEEDTDTLIDDNLQSLEDIWSIASTAEIETDAELILDLANSNPPEQCRIMHRDFMRSALSISCPRVDRAMELLVERRLAQFIKKDVWQFAKPSEPANAISPAPVSSKFDILLDDRLNALHMLFAPKLSVENRRILIGYMNAIAALRQSCDA